MTECAARHDGVRVELGRAESIPFETGRFDHAMSQLVLHFVRVRSGHRLHTALFDRLGQPGGPLEPDAVTLCAVARTLS